MKTVIKNGHEWCSVKDASRYLKKTPTYIRLLMAEGSLDCALMEAGADLLVSVADLKKKLPSRR